MSGGGGGNIIIGDKPLIDQLEQHKHLVATFRVHRLEAIIKEYRQHGDGSVTPDEQQFLLRCAADIGDR